MYVVIYVYLSVLLCVSGLLLDLLLCFIDSEFEFLEEIFFVCKIEYCVILFYYYIFFINILVVVYVKRLGIVFYVLLIKFVLIL